MTTGSGTAEHQRLADARDRGVPWRKWGPYLSERQWGTVREDYSGSGDAWNYFTHDQARSRAYHWGEDGLAGFSDDQQRLCFALALWNGKDPILKERLFGLSNAEGNHGEDVKEYYFYLDSTPTHSYMGHGDRGIVALVNPARLRRLLAYLLDENEFLSPYGIRSLSRWHEKHPYVFRVGDDEYRVTYLPAESDVAMFGGNSNWRGLIWFPVNALLIRALLQFYAFYGDTLKIECPTGSGHLMNLFEVAREITNRLTRIFLRDEHGRRPVYGETEKFQTDPHWRDHLLSYEYFHGENGAGLGASHQTGWTGLVATLLQLFGHLDGPTFLEVGRAAVFAGARSNP